MDFSNMNIWCWLIPLLCTLLGAVFGYLLGKDKGGDLKLLQDKNAKIQADLDACNGKLSAKATSPVASFTAGSTAPSAIPYNAAAAKAAFGKAIKQDDLKVIEGIGPKIESMFKNAGVNTWKELSESAVADCQKVLDGGGARYKIHDPSSWPMQSKMAYEGKWSDLSKWQDEHNHGKL